MKRTLAAALVLATVAGAAGAATPAQPVRFKVTLQASRTTDWAFSATAEQCTPIVATSSGKGRETISFSAARPLVLGEAGLRNPLRTGSTVSVVATRTGSLVQTFSGAPCALPFWDGGCRAVPALNASWNGELVPCNSTLVADSSGCGTAKYELRSGRGLYIGYGRDADDPDALNVLSVQLHVEAPLFGVCPALRGKTPRGIFAFPRMPLRQLLRRKLTVLRGSDNDFAREFGAAHPEATGTTHAEWMIRFERIAS